MTFLQAVILECLRKINGERTVYSIYHLLNGKKSSQTIQDAHLFDLKQYFKTVPQLNRREYDNNIALLEEAGFVFQYNDVQKYKITEHGEKRLRSILNQAPQLLHLNGWNYQDTAIHVWKRLTLLVQAISHLNYQDNRYQAIQKDPNVYIWIKQFLKNYNGGRKNLATDLHAELHRIFSGNFPDNPLLIVLKLTGRQLIGLTNKQVADTLGIEETECHFRFLNALHFIIETTINSKETYPLVYTIISDIFQPIPYTQSTLKTYELLQNNMTIDQVAKIRKLRRSTIEDHVIEIALMNQYFTIDHFIDSEKREEIKEAVKFLGKRKLKPIMEKVEHVSYFQIRLVLARLGEKI